VLKLSVASKLKSVGYLVLDTQNFLIKPWDPNAYELDEGKVPYRHTDMFSMPMEIWEQYSKQLGIEPDDPSSYGVAIATPMFLHTELVNELINTKENIREFSKWFKFATCIKSEFVLYVLWAIKNNSLDKCHQQIDDYASPYLRDCNSDEEFKPFIDFIGVHEPHRWISINHRAWGNMTAKQYSRLFTKLKKYNLVPHFDEYRKSYTDLKF
jgi:hypothetical protein